MRTIDPRQFRLVNKKRGMPRWAKITLISLGVLAGVFVLANVAMGLMYRGKVLPNYSVAGKQIGGIGFDDLDEKVSVETLLPEKVKFQKDSKTESYSPKDLGVTVDWAATQEHIKKTRSWLPFTSLFGKKNVPAELKLDDGKFADAAKGLEKTFTKAPLPERIVFKDTDFAIAAPEDGYSLDLVKMRVDLIAALEQGKGDLPAPTVTTKSDKPTGKLSGDLAGLRKQLDAKITLISGSQKKQLTRAQLGAFFRTSGQTMVLSDDDMSEVVADVASDLGVTPVNGGQAVLAAQYALQKKQTVNFVLAGQGARVYHYCVAAKGISASKLPEFKLKLAAVYGDPKGWTKGGDVALVYAESGCDFTAWLSAAANVTDFSSSICDNTWSCRVGPNVIINYDRWVGASDSWNAAGGKLEDYRIMVINHETGHWFGFAHRNCPGDGQPAPVMQQQSISLQGCTFNPYPTASELAVL